LYKYFGVDENMTENCRCSLGVEKHWFAKFSYSVGVTKILRKWLIRWDFSKITPDNSGSSATTALHLQYKTLLIVYISLAWGRVKLQTILALHAEKRQVLPDVSGQICWPNFNISCH